MSTSLIILQSIRNNVDTAESGWTTFAKSIKPVYRDAFQTHKTTLSAVKQAIQLEAQNGWAAFNLALSLVGGFWVPRLLKPLQGAHDELVGAWLKDTLTDGMRHAATEAAKEAQKNISGTLMDKLKSAAVGGTNSSYEPVVESTEDWGDRLEHGITKRAFILKNSLDPLIRDADRWSVRAAEALEQSFLKYCPFIIDMPLDGQGEPPPQFLSEFRRLSELGMWRNWALARNEKWWKENPNHSDIHKMGPIFTQMTGLGVSPNEIANYQNWSGVSIAHARRPGWRFDMNKFINWAKKVNLSDLTNITKKINAPESCRLPVENKLIIKPSPTPNVCHSGIII